MFGFFDIMQKGGPLMWGIFICSVISLAVFIERMWHLHRARIDTQRFVEGILTILKRNKIMEAVEICEHTPGPIAHILKSGIMKHDRPRSDIWHGDLGPDSDSPNWWTRWTTSTCRKD